PLAGVTVSMDGVTATTDAAGRFLLPGVRAGEGELMIDGRTASASGARYGVFEAGVETTKGLTTDLPFTIWMPEIDWAHRVDIASPTTSEVVVTTPDIPGLEVHIPPGTVIRDTDGTVVHRVSITAIPIDRPPFPLPLMGVQVPVYFTIQPGGA